MRTESGKTICTIAVLCIIAAVMTGFDRQPGIRERACIHELEFGGVYIECTIDEFNSLGFAYGDSVDVSFSSGYTLEDLPYYNGYYTALGEPLLIAYPGYDYIKAAINNGDDLWDTAGLDENSTAEITLRERGKYLEVQNARDIHYEDDRALYGTDEEFANFRSVEAGKLRTGILYRSASPCDNQHNRAGFVDQLMGEAGVQFILDLSDSDEKIQGYMEKPDFNSPYFAELYEAGKVLPIGLNMNYGSEEFRGKVVRGLSAFIQNDGPYLVHCTEGKDRTGFVCMLIEALAGASYEEIKKDYMITFNNYYGIKEGDEKYSLIVENLLVPMIRSIADDENVDPGTADLSSFARNFLVSGGMKDEQIDELIKRLTEE